MCKRAKDRRSEEDRLIERRKKERIKSASLNLNPKFKFKFKRLETFVGCWKLSEF